MITIRFMFLEVPDPARREAVRQDLWLTISCSATCDSTDKSVCATPASPASAIVPHGKINVAQTLLSVLVEAGPRELYPSVLACHYFPPALLRPSGTGFAFC